MDNHSTTPVDPRVLEAMLPYFSDKFGNAASRSHAYGFDAEAAVERAREQIGRVLHASPKDIVFTSGATESNNLAIKGVVEFYKDRGNHVITVGTEHKSVLDTCKTLERAGRIQLTKLRVDTQGRVDPEQIRAAITDKTILISVMHANNEIGTIQPLREIGAIAKQQGVLFHTDATQSVGKIEVDVEAMGIDLLSLSAHKVYGPKGCGALFVRSKSPRVRLVAQIDGGGHERGMRSGTLNVPGIVGLGSACALAAAEMASEGARQLDLRQRLFQGLCERLDAVSLNGSLEHRLPGNLNLSFAHIDGESLLMGLRDVAVSSGSACTSLNLEPSHVLKAIGRSDGEAHTSIRFGLGRFNTADDVSYVIERVTEEVTRLRRFSPHYAASKRAAGG